MKKLYLIGILMLVILSLAFTSVYAITATVNLNGDNKVEPGTTNKISVSIASSDTIGGIEGKIVTSSNITQLSEQSITGKNGWTVTYNAADGSFNAFKATGTKGEEILEIEYTVGNQEGTAKIELKDLTITNIEYQEEEIGDISKTINIEEKESEDPKDEDKNQVTPENTVKPDDAGKETKNIPASKSDSSSSKASSLPRTGIFSILVPIAIIGAIVGVGSYLGYKKYRGIK